eukprot:CAMPEP_0113231822 /NCGR_PEP_ID=MMETSP0008_2-20120614/1625_1 /TAXON_ID=97485 /ORGANISM="Prymnesium parvum" /LENGTH=69 /DNA_ID=CAMNT_0000078503 /DNA_START=738 /DNA_END=947 /DNA_ORIENTATION=- /assembly_acc=CAM_ASM_000153
MIATHAEEALLAYEGDDLCRERAFIHEVANQDHAIALGAILTLGEELLQLEQTAVNIADDYGADAARIG